MDDPADKVDLATMLAAQLAQRDEEHRKREAEGIRIIAGSDNQDKEGSEGCRVYGAGSIQVRILSRRYSSLRKP
jgi:hypothetical protein